MAKAEFPNDERGVKNQRGHDGGENKARHEPQHRVGVGEAHDSETDVLAKQERRRLGKASQHLGLNEGQSLDEDIPMPSSNIMLK